MANASNSPAFEQISFKRELLRKATHMGALVIPGGYYFLKLDKTDALTIMIPVTIAMILIDISRLRQWKFWKNIASKVISPLVRNHELAGDFTGATYILTSFCVIIALYGKGIAVAAMAFTIVGDSFAAIIGRKYGHHKLFITKSWEGSLACLAGTVIVAFIIPGIPLSVVMTGAVVAAVVEAIPCGIDDNVTVPVLSGLVMTILSKIMVSS